jgi:hypothetical protein
MNRVTWEFGVGNAEFEGLEAYQRSAFLGVQKAAISFPHSLAYSSTEY